MVGSRCIAYARKIGGSFIDGCGAERIEYGQMLHKLPRCRRIRGRRSGTEECADSFNGGLAWNDGFAGFALFPLQNQRIIWIGGLKGASEIVSPVFIVGR